MLMHAAVRRANLRVFTNPGRRPRRGRRRGGGGDRRVRATGDRLGLARERRLMSTRSGATGAWLRHRRFEAGLRRRSGRRRPRDEAEAFQWLVWAHYASPTTVSEGIAFASRSRAPGPRPRRLRGAARRLGWFRGARRRPRAGEVAARRGSAAPARARPDLQGRDRCTGRCRHRDAGRRGGSRGGAASTRGGPR